MNTILKKTFILSLLINNTFFASLDNKTSSHLLPIAYAAGSGISGYMAYTFNKKAHENKRQLYMITNNITRRELENPEEAGENLITHAMHLANNQRISTAAGLVSFVLLTNAVQEFSKKDLANASCQLI
jgi:hypothetical protein